MIAASTIRLLSAALVNLMPFLFAFNSARLVLTPYPALFLLPFN